MTLSHEQAQAYLHAAADGMLAAVHMAELQLHLDDCAECKDYAAELHQLERRLTRSLKVRWPGPNLNDPCLVHNLGEIQSRAAKLRWLRRAFESAQAVAWTGSIVALVVLIGWLFSTVASPLATTPTISPTPTAKPTPQALVERLTPDAKTERDTELALTICTGTEPESLYIFGNASLAANHIHQAIYDGPIDSRGFGYQPVILERLPGLSNGDAVTETVTVGVGERVINDGGSPVTLAPGVRVRPAGCYASQCAVDFDETPVVMERLIVTFTLKTGITWSDGEPLGAHDSVYGFELDTDADTPSDKQLVERTATYVALDDYTTVWVGLPGYRDASYTTNFWTPLPAHAWGELTALELTSADESNRLPLGWGPFAIEEWIQGDHITLVKNEHYWRASEGLPHIDTVTVRFVGQNASTNIAALLAGECDILDQTTQLETQSEMLLELQAVGKLNATFVTGAVWEHADFGINPVPSYDRPDIFQDVHVRRAIAHCMDRQTIVDSVLYGQSQVLHSFLPSEHPLYDAEVQKYPFDPAAGAALLESAGWVDDDGNPTTPRVAKSADGIPDGTPLTFTYRTTTADLRQAATTILQTSLARCGIGVTLEYWNPSELFVDGPEGPVFGRRFDMAQFAWRNGIQPPCQLYLCSRVPTEENGWNGDNNTGFCNANYDAACMAAQRSLPGTPEYEAFYRDAQRLFAEQLPVIPLYLHVALAATRPDVEGFIMDPTADSEFWNIEAFRTNQ